MRVIRSLVLCVAVVFAAASVVSADIVELKDGRRVDGRVLLFDGKHVRVALSDRVEAIAVEDVASIRFGEQPAAEAVTSLPPGTLISVVTVDSIDSKTAANGQTFRATLDEDLILNGVVVQSAGAPAVLGLTSVKVARGIRGRTEVTLSLVSVSVGGQMITVKTEAVASSSDGKGANVAKNAGGLGALGGVAGHILGGRAGAIIGATVGGAGGMLLTKAPQVSIAPETKLSFTVQ